MAGNNSHGATPSASASRSSVLSLGSAPGSTVVLNSDGKGARELIGDEKSPVRWFVIGIVDE